jgi:polyhydroxyalkanoate synthesis regulator phasin
MKLRLALEEKLMDVRVRDRLLAEGKITKEELKKYLDSLSDEAKNAVSLDQDEQNKIQ